MNPPRVFISSTSRDLREIRREVGFLVNQHGRFGDVQEIFSGQPDRVTVPMLLEGRLRPCVAVIHICGFYHGAEPDPPLHPERPRSYTQLEYDYAKDHDLPVLVLLADEATFLPHCPEQSPEHAARQLEHYRTLSNGKGLYYLFKTIEDIKPVITSFLNDHVPIATPQAKPQNLPFISLERLFVGRDPFLENLKAHLHRGAGDSAAAIVPAAVHGLGGQGKTRTAIEYAWREKENYQALLFVSGSSPETLRDQIANLCETLRIPSDQAPPEDPTRRYLAALDWLAKTPGWLLLIDNVDTDASHKAVRQLLPKLTRGHTIITSRIATWSAGVKPFALDILAPEDGAQLILRALEGQREGFTDDEPTAREISKTLRGHSLALQQAAAYILQRGVNLATYLAHWEKRRAHLLTKSPKLEDYDLELLTTWDTTFEQLSAPARFLIQCLSFYAADPIPRPIVTAIPLPDQADAEDALIELTRWHFATFAEEGQMVIIHNLVQIITRHHLLEKGLGEEVFHQSSFPLLACALQFDGQDVRVGLFLSRVTPHFIEVAAYAESFGCLREAVLMITQAARVFEGMIIYSRAEELYRRALKIAESIPNEEGDLESAGLSNLASFLVQAGMPGEAEPMIRRAIQMCSKRYGEGLPQYATLLGNLALLLSNTNRRKEAEEYLRQSLDIMQKYYGQDAPEITPFLHNLAVQIREKGDLGEAEAILRRGLVILRSADEAHADVDHFLDTLAGVLVEKGDVVGAEGLFRESLRAVEVKYPANHPRVGVVLSNLAQLLKSDQRYDEAEILMRRALDIVESRHSSNHPYVAAMLNNLAQLLKGSGRSEEAEPLSRRQLEILFEFQRKNGHEHPHLQDAAGNYFLVLQQLGLSDDLIMGRLSKIARGESVGGITSSTATPP